MSFHLLFVLFSLLFNLSLLHLQCDASDLRYHYDVIANIAYSYRVLNLSPLRVDRKITFYCLAQANGHVCSRLPSDSCTLNNLNPGYAINPPWCAVVALTICACSTFVTGRHQRLWFHGKISLKWNIVFPFVKPEKIKLIHLFSLFEDLHCLLHACLPCYQEMRERGKTKQSSSRGKREGEIRDWKSGLCSESAFHALGSLKIRSADWQPDLKCWSIVRRGE